MSKHLTSQRFVIKIHTSRLRRAKWNVTLTISQARENKELVALSDSQIMRFIDELNHITNPTLQIAAIKSQIQELKQDPNLARSRPKIKKLYEELDALQFKKDYVCVVIDSPKDYHYIYQHGFKINGVPYQRLLGTTGGVKNNTIVFVTKKLYPELKRRIDNGRNLEKPFTPAKLEAYKALVCSSSTPVSLPKGIAVVHECITHFTSDVIELDDTDLDQPSMKYIKQKEITLVDSDGYGLAMPQLMERWGAEIGEHFLLPGCVIRNSFCKGCVFPVDFQKFARDHNKTTITDVWGNPHNIEHIELILTQSMMKLWDSYASLEEYLSNCEKNHYTFAITKSSVEHLEHVRTMNYQFLQSYDFSDAQIDELIAPTVSEIKDILSDDYRKTILYAKGCGLNEKNISHLDSSFATALMIEPKMIDDPYVKDQLHTMIQKRIDDAKVGVLTVPANYSLVSGDPYALCQSMFGLKVTGLLKPGQVYSKYWASKGIDQIVSFRAPMTSHNNIRSLQIAHNAEMDEFYQYMTTPTIFNCWDTCADAMNGFDKDGDCVINTAFPLLVEHTKELPAIVCVQRKAPKCIPTEDDLMQSNLDSFGNAVGEVTNKITSMYEVQARFEKDSRPYRILDYRIKCGQLYQQNQIDKTKGIEAKEMPKSWHQWSSNKISDGKTSSEKKERWQNQSLTADKKPYFMQYIYPAQRIQMQEYQKKSNEKSILQFRIPLEELLAKEEKTPEEETFIRYYHEKMPLGTAPCTINKICWKLEAIFDHMKFAKPKEFDYSILKSDMEYSKDLYKKIQKLYEKYRRETSSFMQYAKSERIKSEEWQMQRYLFKEAFKQQCAEQCPNQQILCNIILDLCYSNPKYSKQFAWDICGGTFIQNLLKRNHNIISYPTLDEDGDITFQGMRFTMKTVELTHLENFEMEDTQCQLY